ncbi:hypothetical protein L249_6762 [Ophiocordyceps polyrhachis-furcata BCC 54312]|uniref:Autophagy-related protein 1 n=1 Tax=Ophiocordyceps polyrhachis-furcata BCC 54312 TaxID=1330021 RepID=A0A367LKQ0_9HYPO|nr:hypothetical protein L249_6762 [Ophiocordyceps polyrhachis-furcata BCC 54312]
MDGEEQTQTQATQNVLDPRRLGKQNSGFSDDDVSDIICVLYPHSKAAQEEVYRLACEDSPHVVGKEAADHVEPDYDAEDHASRFHANPTGSGEHAIVLRLSAQTKNPTAGFAFGRNAGRCDIVFVQDPKRRISNVHFCIYVNEYGNVMIRDSSTNGTAVDRQLLNGNIRAATGSVTKWVLSSGSVIRVPVHEADRDLTFRVRIPRRDAEYDRAYIAKVQQHFAKHPLQDANAGHVDLFKTPPEPINATTRPSTFRRKETTAIMNREWTGSGKYNVIGIIGKGAFAVVHRVTAKYDGRPYAAKEIEKRRFMKNGVLDQKVENEMKIMRRVQHVRKPETLQPNIVRYMENFEWDNRLLIIIMELVPGGDLGKHVSEGSPFSEPMTQDMVGQLLSALGYLHANNITHRDVKPDNILIHSLEPLQVKLTDFGLSKIVTEQTFLQTFCGTLLYCAPEVYTEYDEYDDKGARTRGKKSRRARGQRYSHAVDVWSLGGVLFFALTGSPPYPADKALSPSELLHNIMTTMLDIWPLQCCNTSEHGIDFLHRMLQRRPESRATITELENHPWQLTRQDTPVPESQPYDQITDDETADAPDDEPDHISDSGAEDENERPRPRRLFGEISASAVGSSGVIPADYLDASVCETDILQPNDSGDSDRDGPRHYHLKAKSTSGNQSTDQLQSLVDDVASQSLGGGDEPRSSAQASMDANSSKRKPPLSDPSGDAEGFASLSQPTIKRLKSQEADVSEQVLCEELLLASVPQVKRPGSRRLVDHPVDKVTFWEQDVQTWHLQYPEMTQLQYDAFSEAARCRGEEFAPGQTPLWDLAMKHFAPIARPKPGGLGRDDRRPSEDDLTTLPSTAPADASERPDLRPPDSQIVVPVQGHGRAIAVIESLPDSYIKNISFPVTDSLASFGRGRDNTQVFRDRMEPRVPKYAFKMLLWREGYDPSKDPSKSVPPWKGDSSAADDLYHFWLSTKASLGIRINGHPLASSDAQNPTGPSKHWTRIYDGDSLVIWGGHDPQQKTHLVFRCFWGGSSKARPQQGPLGLADASLAKRLDAACQRTEKRVRDVAERRRRANDAKREQSDRQLRVEEERQRSQAFEKKRQAAIEHLAATQQFNSRRGTPGTHLSSYASRLQGTAAVVASRQSR